MMTGKIAIVLTLAALTVGPGAAHARLPKGELKCRTALAQQGVAAAAGALKALDACHQRRDKGQFAGDCNTVDPGGLTAKLGKVVQRACKSAPQTLAGFAGGDAASAIAGVIADQLSASGRVLQGAPTLGGDKTKLRCHAAIGKGRSLVVNGIVRGATACQRGRDKGGSLVGPIAADCASASTTAGTRATSAIARACGTVGGADVGSCPDLPGCVVTSASSTGRSVASAFYSVGSQGPECGNNVIEEGEQCDPGSLVSDTCVNCKPRGCGDGLVDRPAGEECDDENTASGDGCDATCHIETVPGGTRVDVTVRLVYDPAVVGDVAGVEMTVDYQPTKVSLPGSGNVASTGGRVTNVGPTDALFNISDRDVNPADGTDDQLFIPYGLTPVLPPGNLVKVTFDGTPGATPSASDFVCTVTTSVDQLGLPIGGVTCGLTVVVSAITSTSSTTSSSTSTVPPPPTTTSTLGGTSTTTTVATIPSTTTTSSTSTTVTTAPPPTTSTTSTTLGGPAICGNGTREGAEQCDDGNDLNTDACTNACQDARCGDGLTWDGVEDCDDANANDADACLSTCRWAPAVCGDGIRQFGESCDDGNTVNGDSCPAACVIAACVPGTTRVNVSVVYSKPAAVSVGGLQLFLDYPEGKVSLPGLGNATSVRQRITGLPAGFASLPNDVEYALRESLVAQVQGSTLNPAVAVFKLGFDACFGTAAPTAGEFTCTVEGASTPQGQDINLITNPVTCSVTIP